MGSHSWLLVLCCLLQRASALNGTLATLRDGQLRGLRRADVLMFRAIPYAAAPLGQLRWQPPAAVTPWEGVRDATSNGQICIQGDGESGSEDCEPASLSAAVTASAAFSVAVAVAAAVDLAVVAAVVAAATSVAVAATGAVDFAAAVTTTASAVVAASAVAAATAAALCGLLLRPSDEYSFIGWGAGLFLNVHTPVTSGKWSLYSIPSLYPEDLHKFLQFPIPLKSRERGCMLTFSSLLPHGKLQVLSLDCPQPTYMCAPVT